MTWSLLHFEPLEPICKRQMFLHRGLPLSRNSFVTRPEPLALETFLTRT